jgi:DNA polymerase-3 subunit alpha
MQKLAVLDQVLDAASNAQKARASGQSSLFDFMGTTDTSTPVNTGSVSFPMINETREHRREQLSWEKELLGMYISDHPVVQALRDADLSGITTLGTINDEMVGQSLSFAGMLTGTKTVTTKKGDTMFVGNFEDIEGTLECVAFPKAYEKFKALLHDDAVVRIIGKLDRRNDGLQLMIDKVEVLVLSDELPAASPSPARHEEAPHTTTASAPAVPPPAPAAPAAVQPAYGAPAPMTPPNDAPKPRPQAGANDVIKTQRSQAVAPKAAPTPAPVTNEITGPAQVLRIYFPHFDNTESAVALMHEIYALTEHFRTASHGDAILMIHLPVDERNVVLRMRGEVRDPLQLSDALRQHIGPDAIILESA